MALAEAGAAVAMFGRNEDENGGILDDLRAIGRASLVMNVDVTDRNGRPRVKTVSSDGRGQTRMLEPPR